MKAKLILKSSFGDGETVEYITQAQVEIQNGSVFISYTENPDDIPDGFASDTTDISGWKEITVPGNWELQGFGIPIYVNIGYEFPDRICRKLRLGAMNVQMTMSDIFRLSSVRVERGTDYPFARTISFSIGLTF